MSSTEKATAVEETEGLPPQDKQASRADKYPFGKDRGKSKPSLKWRLVRIVLICWICPVLLVSGAMFGVASNSLNEKTIEGYKETASFNAHIVTERLNMAVDASRLTSYDDAIKRAYFNYSSGDDFSEVYTITQSYLAKRFRSDDRFSFALMWFWEAQDEHNCYTYNSSSGGSDWQVRDYWRYDHQQVQKIAKELDTGVHFLNCDGRIYLVRNVMNGQLKPMAVQVLALNADYFFDSFAVIPWQKGYNISIDNNTVYQVGEQPARHQSPYFHLGEQVEYHQENGGSVICGVRRGLANSLSYTVAIDPATIYEQLEVFRFILIAMAVFLLPLLLLAVRFFYRNVSSPVQQLLVGAREIEIGNFGYQLRRTTDNREFYYLEQRFNQMSLQLEEMFHRIYDEELALRDARIKALQSQINPHFLNNTLELINWEARMNGDLKVTKMIEALSIMLDAAMARDGRKTVRLCEEMMYVDAYFYIIGERLGKRLTIQKEVDETLLQQKVPRLILQPIIENAVEHGITPRQSGRVTLRIVRQDDWMLLQTINDGRLSEQDAAEIARLLSDESGGESDSARSIGIRNVHQRLRILYGTGSGLSILSGDDDEQVVATIRIPFESEE